MATFLYDHARQAFIDGGINWMSDTIVAYLVYGYVPSQAADQFLSTVAGGNRASGPITLTGKTDTGGVAGADPVVFPSVPAGPACNAVVLAKSTGVDATSPLIAFIDNISYFPVTPNGTNIGVGWDTGPNHIFKL